MATELEDAANWRNLTEFKDAERRLAQLRIEIKLMVVTPLGQLFYAFRDNNPDNIADIDLSTYPEKSEVAARQREMAILQSKIKALALTLKAAGMAMQ